jgi:Ca-activated chloride channel family protein
MSGDVFLPNALYNRQQMKNIRLFFAIAICVFLPASLAAQRNKKAQPPKEDAPQTLSVNVDLVNVLFTVADKNGRFITNLQKNDFKVTEDYTQQTISNFSNETNLPLSIGLVFDTSASILGKLKFEQEAAGEFFYTTLRRGTDKAFVVTFDNQAGLAQDFTDNSELLTKSLTKVHSAGTTALFDAVYEAVANKLVGQQGRHVIIVISDGDDNSSERSIDDTIEMAQKSDTVIYAVGTNPTELFGSTRDRGNRFLKRLTEETGGRLFLPVKLEDLTQSFLQISEELRSQYTLGYFSSNTKRDGSYRRIKITTTNKLFRVRAREGYYASRANPS